MNKETHCNKDNTDNDLKDNNEYKVSTSINSNINSLYKGQEKTTSYPKQDTSGFKTSKDGYGTQPLSHKQETNEFCTKSKIKIDLGDKPKVSSNARQDECTKLKESRMLLESTTKEKEKTLSCLKGHRKELETSKEGITNHISQKRINTTKSYSNLKKASDVNNKTQITLKVMQRSDETTSFSKSSKTEIDSGNHLKISSMVNHDEMIRLNELREQSNTKIVIANNKLICSNQTILCLNEDCNYITTSKEKKRHDENKRLKNSRALSKTITDATVKNISCINENIIQHETSKEVFKMKVMQRSVETTVFSTNLKTETDSGNNQKILSKVNQDKMKRLPELREKPESRIVNENNKLIGSQTLLRLKEDSKFIPRSKKKGRHHKINTPLTKNIKSPTSRQSRSKDKYHSIMASS